MRDAREPSTADALVPLLTLVALVGGSIALFGLDALDGPIQVALVVCCMVVAVIALKNGRAWEDVQAAAQGAMSSITSAVFILLAVGALIGTWNMSGTIPTMVHFGIQALSPTWFYVATAVICGAIAMSIGSSWTTAGTIGVGLVGIAALLGLSPAITAGAVISGAYLGDKTSPLSETTILTAQLLKLDIWTHIRAQAWTSVPAFVIAVAGFALIGFVSSPDLHADSLVEAELASLDQVFRISVLNLAPLLLLIVLSIRKVPASLALMSAAIFAGVTGALLQPHVLADFVGTTSLNPIEAIEATWQAMATGFVADTGIAASIVSCRAAAWTACCRPCGSSSAQ